MFRRFDFENEVYATLELVPISVRRKLDLAGVKLHLNQWQALSRTERLVVCHFPAASSEECEVLAAFLAEAVKRCTSEELSTVPPAQDTAADADHMPPEVARLVSELQLNGENWSRRFDPDERYALAKLTRGPADRFVRAWSAFTQMATTVNSRPGAAQNRQEKAQ
jgi:hypothetical protein